MPLLLIIIEFPVFCVKDDSRDELEGIMNETGSVLEAQSGVVHFQQLRKCIPALLIIMNNVISIHVSVELHPVNVFIKQQHIWVWEIENRKCISCLGHELAF